MEGEWSPVSFYGMGWDGEKLEEEFINTRKTTICAIYSRFGVMKNINSASSAKNANPTYRSSENRITLMFGANGRKYFQVFRTRNLQLLTWRIGANCSYGKRKRCDQGRVQQIISLLRLPLPRQLDTSSRIHESYRHPQRDF